MIWGKFQVATFKFWHEPGVKTDGEGRGPLPYSVTEQSWEQCGAGANW